MIVVTAAIIISSLPKKPSNADPAAPPDNTENAERSLPAWSLTDLSLGYTIKIPRKYGFKEIDLGVDMNNLFNAHVAQSGWVYSAIYTSGGHPNDHRYYQIGFIPVAGITVLGHVTLRF